MSYLLYAAGTLLTGLGCYAHHRLNANRINTFEVKKELSSQEAGDTTKVKEYFNEVIKELGVKPGSIDLRFSHVQTCAAGHAFTNERVVFLELGAVRYCLSVPEILKVILRHEIIHIVKNHLLKIPMYSTFVGLASLTWAGITEIDPIVAIGLSALATLASIYIHVNYTEMEATAQSMSKSSHGEIMRFLSDIFANELAVMEEKSP